MARRAGRFNRGPRRPTDWSASAPLTAILSVGQNSAVLDESFVPIVGGETVIRTRGMIGFKSDQQLGDELQIGAFGICKVTAQALSVGITAIPHPSTDAAWGGWLVHQYIMSVFEFASASGVNPDSLHTIVIDSKAMRKIDEDERLVTVWENTSATHAMDVFSSFRFLTKVH